MRIIMNCLLVVLVFFSSYEIAGNEEEILDVEEVNYEPKEEEIRGVVNELYVLHPTFRNKVIKFLYECKKQGISLKILETYRTPERQDSLKRRRLTMLSGGKSKHQHYLAIDVVPIVNGKLQWKDRKLWKKINQIAESQGLRTGYKWQRLFDPGHIEYPIPINKIDTIVLPDTVLIPINEAEWK